MKIRARFRINSRVYFDNKGVYICKNPKCCILFENETGICPKCSTRN